jgi:hypothetical protein
MQVEATSGRLLLLWVGAHALLQYRIVAGHGEDGTDHWTRLNYGLAAAKVQQVCEADEFWHHVIHMELYQVPDEGIPEVPRSRLDWYNSTCALPKGLLRGTQSMVTSMQESVLFLLFIMSHYQHVFNLELIYYFSSYSGLTR